MDRRWILRVLGAAAVAVPVLDRQAASAIEKSPEKNHKLAIHVDVNDPEVMKLALNNAGNAHELYKEWGEEVAIEIVAYSQGFHMLREDTSPVKEEIKALRAKVPTVAFGACNKLGDPGESMLINVGGIASRLARFGHQPRDLCAQGRCGFTAIPQFELRSPHSSAETLASLSGHAAEQ